mmetsp:Transcript_12963/g.28235  ORF Transcript_12963/g.28235 Transcript_12963/m.28235 type:complete len:179 (+) Transcript_12963:86-622(+)
MVSRQYLYEYFVVSTCTVILMATYGLAKNMQESRESSKPWYLRDIELGETVLLPFSPVTVFICVVSLLFMGGVIGSGSGGSKAKASHILVDEAGKDKLIRLKREIGTDYSMFQEAAKKHSKCPSGKSGGSLGTFGPGMMVPPFDKAVFDKESPVGAAIGPVQTQFGWHLLWIEERKLA